MHSDFDLINRDFNEKWKFQSHLRIRLFVDLEGASLISLLAFANFTDFIHRRDALLIQEHCLIDLDLED